MIAFATLFFSSYTSSYNFNKLFASNYIKITNYQTSSYKKIS